MLSLIFKRFADRPYKKFIKKSQPTVEKINELEEQYQSLSDDQLRAHTQQFRERLEAGETLEDILPEAFATVKNAARRLCGQTLSVSGQKLDWNMVHYDVQLMGGLALHQGKIAEMATGEGKTLVATLPLYLNALPRRGSHCVTVNDYLARRDSEWMGYLFKFLGLTVGCIQNSMPQPQKKGMYQMDITYGTASEFGFDYLRDNGMAMGDTAQVQGDHVYCIVDEVDSILVDEARTPLIISGPVQITRELPFNEFKPTVQRLVREQSRFCNALVAEAKADLEKEELEDEFATSMKLLQVRMGMPKNKQLIRMMEEGPTRKMIEKADLEMHNDFRKQELFELKEGLFFVIDEKQHQADLTEKGRQLLKPGNPDAFVLPDLPSIFSDLDKDESKDPRTREEEKAVHQEAFEKVSEEIHTISQLLRAYSLYEKDVEYVVQDNKVQIVDENTGRIMPGRRWSEGLHQAVEAKEGVTIEKETKTYATITIQNYFRQYEKLAGMTGTAETEAAEFFDIYKMEVMVIPTNEPNQREDLNDVIYKTRRAKYNAAIEDIQNAHNHGQPVLVGTASVEASELLSRMLKRQNITHTVLNAKQHEREAEIVARAGQRSAVTIATNMAGRGTDIKLGEGIEEIGGLLVLGTERHESRRIDRQLRGRCARQGDKGSSKFFISLEDNLMRLFAQPGPIASIMEKSFSEDDELAHPLLNRSIESAQKKVEQQNYAIRKRLLQYDDVLNRQREVIYGLRNEALHDEHPKEIIYDMIKEELEVRLKDAALFEAMDEGVENEDQLGLLRWVNTHFPIALPEDAVDWSTHESALDSILTKIREAYDSKEALQQPDAFKKLERWIVVSALDRHWQDHLTEMEELRRSVGLRGYGQKDPLNEYKKEAFTYFEQMLDSVRTQIATSLFRSAVMLEQNIVEALQDRMKKAQATQPSLAVEAPGSQGAQAVQTLPPQIQASGGGQPAMNPAAKVKAEPIRREMPKVGRNEPCPCGSGKKYKHCHGG
ncbi:MAG: preprotein translocase subunit SecA [Opitutaceae bacterium]|nr:preprotein translocase subunit SecA [Opitutaceae bacterium]